MRRNSLLKSSKINLATVNEVLGREANEIEQHKDTFPVIKLNELLHYLRKCV